MFSTFKRNVSVWAKLRKPAAVRIRAPARDAPKELPARPEVRSQMQHELREHAKLVRTIEELYERDVQAFIRNDSTSRSLNTQDRKVQYQALLNSRRLPIDRNGANGSTHHIWPKLESFKRTIDALDSGLTSEILAKSDSPYLSSVPRKSEISLCLKQIRDERQSLQQEIRELKPYKPARYYFKSPSPGSAGYGTMRKLRR